MNGLRTTEVLNAEAVVKGVLRRAADRGVTPNRTEVLEALRFTEDEDVSQWEAMVSEMLARESAERSYQYRVAA